MQGKQGKHARTRYPLGVQERAHGDGACDDSVHLHPGHRVPLAATKVYLHKGLASAYNDTPLEGLVRSRHRTHTSGHTHLRGVQVAIVRIFERAWCTQDIAYACATTVGFPVHLGCTRCTAENMICKARTFLVWCVFVTVVLCLRTCMQYAHSREVYVHLHGHHACVLTGRTSLGCVAHKGRRES
jgi:hypothetical protein